MGTSCNIKINNVMYYKHYDGFQGGLTLNLLESIVNDKICLDTFIKNGKLEVIERRNTGLPLFSVSETEINHISIYDFMLEGLNSIVRTQQIYYESIKADDARSRYFDSLRNEPKENTENKMRLNKIFKNGYPTADHYKDKFDLIERFKNV